MSIVAWLHLLANFLYHMRLPWWSWRIFHGITPHQFHYIYEWALRHGFRPYPTGGHL